MSGQGSHDLLSFLFSPFYQGSDSFTTVKNSKSLISEDWGRGMRARVLTRKTTTDFDDAEVKTCLQAERHTSQRLFIHFIDSRAVIMSPAISSKSLYLRETIWHG
jgi:hypothetical protein